MKTRIVRKLYLERYLSQMTRVSTLSRRTIHDSNWFVSLALRKRNPISEANKGESTVPLFSVQPEVARSCPTSL